MKYLTFPPALVTLSIWLFVIPAMAADPCETKYTTLHYAKSICFDVPRVVEDGSKQTFTIRAVLVTEDLATALSKPTIVIVPGGPGQSSEPIKTELQKKEIINGMWKHMGVNVVLFDPRGTGMSKLPHDTKEYNTRVISTVNFVMDLKAVVDAVSPNQPVYIFAHSAGGHVALRFAEKFPTRVQKMLLLSASDSPRRLAEYNIALYSVKSTFWDEVLSRFPMRAERDQLDQEYQRVNDVLIQQLKARILKQDVHPNLKPVTPMDFRRNILKRLNADPSGMAVAELVHSYYKYFAEMDQQRPLLVPSSLRAAHLRLSNLTSAPVDAKDWIQTQILCGEGMKQEELNTPTVYDGVDMHRFCGNLFAQTIVGEPDWAKITTPIVFLSGAEDVQVPTYMAQEIVGRLPNAKLIVEPGAGHMFFDQKPFKLYQELESLVKPGM